MNTPSFNLPNIEESEQTPLVQELLQIIMQQQTYIDQLEDEISKLKKQNTKPKIRPSQMDKEAGQSNNDETSRPKIKIKKKNEQIKIDQRVQVKAENVPQGSVFKGYQEYIVQDIIIKPNNTCLARKRWQTPDGTYVIAPPPKEVSVRHFGSTLISFILYQYYNQHVTQPLLLEQLREYEIEISAGQLNRILTEDKEVFHQEKEAILEVGCEVSDYIQTDDTGKQNKGKNGYCTLETNYLLGLRVLIAPVV
jgi:hypothetical protein